MDKQYLINVWKSKRLWRRIEIDHPWAEDVVHDLLTKLLIEEGYSFEFFIATDERRIIESSKNGVRLLVRKPLYKPVSLIDLFQSKA